MSPSVWIRHGHWIILATLVLATLTQGGGSLRWGDGLELVAVGSQLGVAHPPGYPWFTLLLGTAQAMLPGDPYAAALWVCRFAACGVAFVLAVVVRRILRASGIEERLVLAASLLFALAFLFGASLWPTLAVVEVYGTQALSMLLIAALLVFVDGPPSSRALLVTACVQGLAIAHHLTAVALLPLTALALFDHARVGGRRTALIGATLMVALPLLGYASLLLRAPGPGEETLVWGGMQSLGALFEHVRGSEYGAAQLLMADPHTRFALGEWFAFASGRLGMIVASFGSLFVGEQAVAPFLGLVGLVLVAIGARHGWRRAPRATLGLLLAIALQVGFVTTYNIADIGDYFLAIEVLLVPLGVQGLWTIVHRGRPSAGRGLSFAAVALPAVLLLLTIPLNASTARPDSAPIAARYQSRLLGALPAGAGVITAESGDLFLLWYTRFALEGRRDLFVLPANLLDRPWIRATLPAGDPRREAIGFREGGMERLQPYVEDLRAKVIEPMLDHGSVYTTIRTVAVLEALAAHYEFRQAAELLRRDELEQLRRDALPGAPAVLWELRRRPG